MIRPVAQPVLRPQILGEERRDAGVDFRFILAICDERLRIANQTSWPFPPDAGLK